MVTRKRLAFWNVKMLSVYFHRTAQRLLSKRHELSAVAGNGVMRRHHKPVQDYSKSGSKTELLRTAQRTNSLYSLQADSLTL